MNFEITWDVMPDPAVDALPKTTRDRMQKIFDVDHRKPKTVISELREPATRHPQIPCLTNWLISALRPALKSCIIRDGVHGSDHCPVEMVVG